MWSEFSGYGTAELALQAVCKQARPDWKVHPSSADFNNCCREILTKNSDSDTCIFGDILGLADSKPQEQLKTEIKCIIVVSSEHVTEAMKAFSAKKGAQGICLPIRAG